MDRWSPIPENARTVLAESASEEWPWVFEAWRQPDRNGVEQTFFAVRNRRAGSFMVHPVDLEPGTPIQYRFEQREDGDESVFYGSVADVVNAVIVEPIHPARKPSVRVKFVEPDRGSASSSSTCSTIRSSERG